MANRNMNAAKAAKNDEFYTRLQDVEAEMYYYRSHFKDKVIYLNCDDPYVSAFFEFFSKQFEFLGLKKLIATCYKNDEDFTLFTQKANSRGVKLVYGGGAERSLPDPEHIQVEKLQGDGDFRSSECVELLKEADIVVTNPPFSLFREYIALMMEHDKKFIVVGNMGAVGYTEIFPLIKDNKIWLGVSPRSMDFVLPDGSMKTVNATWFTNLEHNRRNYPIDLYKRYSFTPEDFPKYDNYDAIEVSRVADIPEDYTEVMGVPITFIENYCPSQFEILGMDYEVQGGNLTYLAKAGWEGKLDKGYVQNQRKYYRVFIRHKNPRTEPY